MLYLTPHGVIVAIRVISIDRRCVLQARYQVEVRVPCPASDEGLPAGNHLIFCAAKLQRSIL